MGHDAAPRTTIITHRRTGGSAAGVLRGLLRGTQPEGLRGDVPRLRKPPGGRGDHPGRPAQGLGTMGPGLDARGSRWLPVPDGDERVPRPGSQGDDGREENARPRRQHRRPRGGRGSQRARERDAPPHAASASGARAHRIPRLHVGGGRRDPRRSGVHRPGARDEGTSDGSSDLGGMAMIDERERFEEAFELFDRPEPAWDRLIRRRERKRLNQRITAGVVGIAVFLAAVWIVTSAGSLDRTQKPADEPSTTETPEDVARGFIAAFAAFDAEATARTYITDRADLNGLVDRHLPPTEQGLAHFLALLEAQRFELTVTSCQAVPFGSATSVLCEFEWNASASDLLGVGPFPGRFVFTVRDGGIVKSVVDADLRRFSVEMRAPFAEWVAAAHPRDFEVMYTSSIPSDPQGFRRLHGRYSGDSIRLWEQRIPEYVEAVKQGTA